MNIETTFYTIEDKEYLLLAKTKYQNKTYVLLVNPDDEKDFLVQEVNNESPDVLYGVSPEETKYVLQIFLKKMQEMFH